ncbi:MAG TPA: hypothetical protein VFR49_14205, partial [Solirubrobacteraceae bacterium]|nr:hypothetical protein [Solirubrobacteraceae bacterium]
MLVCTGALLGVPAPAALAAFPVTGTTITGVEGSPAGGPLATFTDLALTGCQPASYAATVTWPDGPATAATVTTAGQNGLNCDYLVSGGHTFAEEGAQAFTVAVTSNGIGTGSGSGNGQAQISDAALHSAPVAAFSVPEATTFGATIATFADDDPGGAAGDYGATVAWGDGQSGPAVITVEAGGRFGVFANHRYAQPGAYTATVGIA